MHWFVAAFWPELLAAYVLQSIPTALLLGRALRGGLLVPRGRTSWAS